MKPKQKPKQHETPKTGSNARRDKNITTKSQRLQGRHKSHVVTSKSFLGDLVSWWLKSVSLEAPNNKTWYFEFFSLCAVYGLLAFRLALPFIQKGTTTKSDDFRLYITGWLVGVIGGFLLGIMTRQIARVLRMQTGFLPHLFLNFLFLMFLLTPFSFVPNRGWNYPAFFLLIQGIAFIPAQKRIADIISRPASTRLLYGIGLFSFAALVVFLNVREVVILLKGWTSSQILLCGFVLLSLPASLWFIRSAKKNTAVAGASRSPGWIGYAAVFLVIFYVIYEPHFLLDRFHVDPYVAPLAELNAGKTLFVDAYGQYGVLSYFFLGKIFKILPLDFSMFMLVDTVFRILQYFLFYLVVEKIFGRNFHSFLWLGILVFVNHFAQDSIAYTRPSTGPLRFGFIYILLALVVFRNVLPGRRKLFWVLEAIVVGTAISWGLDTCCYIVPAYLSLLVYESLGFGGRLRLDWKNVALRLGMILIALSAIAGWVYLDCFLRSGSFPDWTPYLDYVSIYKKGYFLMELPPIGLWWAVIGVLYFSLFAVLALAVRKNPPPPIHLNVIFLANVYGVFQFFYYLGRSHPDNLHHVTLSAILLTAYWLFYLRRFNPAVVPRILKNSAFVMVTLFMALYLPSVFPTVLGKMKAQFSNPDDIFLSLRAVFRGPQPDDWSLSAGRLIEKYSGGQNKVHYFLGMDGVTVCLYTGKTSTYPYIVPDVAGECEKEPIGQWYFQYPVRYQEGEYVYFLAEYLAPDGFHPGRRVAFLPNVGDRFKTLEIRLLKKMDEQNPIEGVEESNGVVVGRLGPPVSGESRPGNSPE